MLDFDLFRRVVDEAGPSLGRIDFFNYGEAFLHKRAIEMCEYIKSQLPAHLPLHEHQRPGVHRGRRRGGWCTPGSTRSRSRSTAPRRRATRSTGSAATSTRRSATCATAADEKRAAGRDVPFLNWRYILFTHNDSDEEMEQARAMAADIGVDRLCWEITDHPEDMFSRRFVPGSAELDGDPARDLGRQQPRQRDPRRDAARADRRAAARCRRRCRSSRARAQPVERPDARPQPLDPRLSRAGELRPAAGAARRAALRRGRHRHQPRLRARLAARSRSQPGASTDVPMTITAPASRAATR